MIYLKTLNFIKKKLIKILVTKLTVASDYESKPQTLRHILSITGHISMARTEGKIKMTRIIGDFILLK